MFSALAEQPSYLGKNRLLKVLCRAVVLLTSLQPEEGKGSRGGKTRGRARGRGQKGWPSQSAAAERGRQEKAVGRFPACLGNRRKENCRGAHVVARQSSIHRVFYTSWFQCLFQGKQVGTPVNMGREGQGTIQFPIQLTWLIKYSSHKSQPHTVIFTKKKFCWPVADAESMTRRIYIFCLNCFSGIPGF